MNSTFSLKENERYFRFRIRTSIRNFAEFVFATQPSEASQGIEDRNPFNFSFHVSITRFGVLVKSVIAASVRGGHLWQKNLDM
jgi:hypothetical protein